MPATSEAANEVWTTQPRRGSTWPTTTRCPATSSAANLKSFVA